MQFKAVAELVIQTNMNIDVDQSAGGHIGNGIINKIKSAYLFTHTTADLLQSLTLVVTISIEHYC